jgi:ubiquinol-cytochrome c reductase cytochrome b subunit
MALSIVVLLVLPWLDKSPVKSMRYRGLFSRLNLTMFVVSFLALMYLGLLPAEGLYVYLARIFTVLYFLYFAMLWVIPKFGLETCKPVPERVVFHAH